MDTHKRMTLLIQKVVEILEKSETLLVPVKKLWLELKEEYADLVMARSEGSNEEARFPHVPGELKDPE